MRRPARAGTAWLPSMSFSKGFSFRASLSHLAPGQAQEHIFQVRLFGAQVAELDSLPGQQADHLAHQLDLTAVLPVDGHLLALDLDPARLREGLSQRRGGSSVQAEDDALLR